MRKKNTPLTRGVNISTGKEVYRTRYLARKRLPLTLAQLRGGKGVKTALTDMIITSL